MDSLDVYLEKKQERLRYLRTPPKRAAALSASMMLPNQKTSEQVSRVKPSVFAPSVFSTAHINTNFAAIYKTPSADAAGRFADKTGATQNSVNAKQPFKENRLLTPGDKAGNKSILSTSVISAKKPVFDLKASLAKPLGYTPHRGKLKPFSLAHVDVKQATKAKIRDQRRNEIKAMRQVQRQATQMARRQ